MDNFSILSRAKTNMSLGLSKLSAYDSFAGQNTLKFQDKLCHKNCNCFHCINDTKPIQHPLHPRIPALNEYKKQNNQAYAFLIQKMTAYIGTLKIPDTFIAQNSSFVYVSNNKPKIKTKLNLTMNEVKKYFDTRKIQYNKIIKNQNEFHFGKIQRTNSKKLNNQDFCLTIQQKTTSEPLKRQKVMKQIALINYRNDFKQIVTESSLNKYLARRKNDPFWEQISTISLIPPYKEDELTYHRFFYERTQSNLEQMEKQMQRMADMIDCADKHEDITSVISLINPQNESNKVIVKICPQEATKQQLSRTINTQFPLGGKIQADNLNQQKIDCENTARISKQLVAYFQVKLHIRISSCLFKYMIDFEGNFYLTGVQKFIAHNLKPQELHFVHDRFEDFEIEDSEQIAGLKMQIESQQSRVLEDELAEVVADCLQKRKNELQGIVYSRPRKQKLVKIFKRIFPTFNEEQVFTNKNWKNEFPLYILKCRQTINSVIRNDQGIRILKRFGINFYRTWS